MFFLALYMYRENKLFEKNVTKYLLMCPVLCIFVCHYTNTQIQQNIIKQMCLIPEQEV